jgi:hypothetical protein
MIRVKDLTKEEVPLLPLLDLNIAFRIGEALLRDLDKDSAKQSLLLKMRNPVTLEEWEKHLQQWSPLARNFIQGLSYVWEWDVADRPSARRRVTPDFGLIHTNSRNPCLREVWQDKGGSKLRAVELSLGQLFPTLTALHFQCSETSAQHYRSQTNFVEIEQLRSLLRWCRDRNWLENLETIVLDSYYIRSRTQFEKVVEEILLTAPNVGYIFFNVLLRTTEYNRTKQLAVLQRHLPKDFQVVWDDDSSNGIRCYSKQRLRNNKDNTHAVYSR